MKLPIINAAVLLLSSATPVLAQTYSDCNPLGKTCPAKPAFGTSGTFDFTQGQSNDFASVGGPTYGSDGVEFTVAKQGDAPLIQSGWYIMFGHVEFVIKAAPGTGIVSSAVLQSDDLDEIDWEWLGGNNVLVQSNYFGKGNTDSFNRGATHNNVGNHDDFHTYTIDWTSQQIVWQIDGKTVRVLTPDTAATNQYPQTPMMVKVGVWAGGDPNNPQGTIDWAGGKTDYSAGPYTMYLKSLKVTDYSTGTEYSYSDQSGSWQSIRSTGGKINGNIAAESISTVESAPAITSTVASIPIPWSGTHRQTSSFVTPSIWPWVPRATTATPGESRGQGPLPSGWTFSGSRQVQPPSAASSCHLSTFVSSLLSQGSASPSGTRSTAWTLSSTRLLTNWPTQTQLASSPAQPASTSTYPIISPSHTTITSTDTAVTDTQWTTSPTRLFSSSTLTTPPLTTTGSSFSTAEASSSSGPGNTPAPTTTAHIAPNVGAANTMFDARLSMVAIYIVVGSVIVMF
ncbi:concanavalin A-like lectin/glucanase domain-containing protein [Aspergillus bertholletiae]|uniref:Crh-like protein n=1 Tax=Aspergillus bertholletiae TaxID=1226010 RepID=A0A5N7B5M8_9EURO|nr:concanavalin A-like lectin/glucanase domain-containing protein [Aspergillus bertholletiae]